MTTRYNESFLHILDQLAEFMLKKGEPFRARAYQKAQETILNMTSTDITDMRQLQGQPNIGSHIFDKLEEFVETGTIDALEKEKENPAFIFSEIYGVGPKKAQELVGQGITTIAHLRARQNDVLNNIQRIGLQYYEDILKRIPREEIDQFADVFQNAFDKHVSSSSSYQFEIVGSYRRGAATSGDIDVIITSSDPNVYKSFVDYLIREKVILEVLSRGPSKCLVIAKLFRSDVARRVDFLFCSQEEFPFAILYFTGSKIFNTMMRHVALTQGYTMNEHGIFDLSDKKRITSVEFKEEKDIFQFLGLVYKEPKDRIDGRSVKVKELKVTSTATTLKNKAISAEKEKEKDKKTVTRKRPLSHYTVVELIHDFQLKGNRFLDKLTESQLVLMLTEASDKYYNTDSPLMNDAQFDMLQDFINEKYPLNSARGKIGAPIASASASALTTIEKTKVTLPYFMGSMNKIKPEGNALQLWNQKYKGPYVISCKLDGISGLFTTEGTEGPKLYTRGDGIVGQDVSHLIPYLKAYLPVDTKDITVRGEFIMPKAVFQEKYSKDFANARNMMAGIINQKGVDKKISDVHFVAYEVILPSLTPLEQLKFLKEHPGFECVHFALAKVLSKEVLAETLKHWREKSDYDIDGVIVSDDKIYPRKNGANPEYAFAFKMVLDDQIAQATVVDVIWSPSKDGYLKPRVQIVPLHLGGVQIEFATGFNAAFIESNHIGPGATIELVRSGDVIPHITKVLIKAPSGGKMPDANYTWNDTHVDIILEDADSNETVREKNITGFFKGLEVDGLGAGNVAKLMATGYDTVPKILRMELSDYLKVEGFQIKTAQKLFTNIREKIESCSIVSLMAASNLFGRGFSKTKIELILNEVPDILVSSDSLAAKIKRVASIKGMAVKTAEAFVQKINDFRQFILECNLESKLSVEATNAIVNPDSPLFGKSIVLTGFRSKALEQKIKDFGGKIGTSVSKSTFAVITKDLEGEMSGKLVDAQKHGVPIMTQDEFIDEYIF